MWFSPITRVFQSAFSRVLEKTIFGVARQTGANWRSCSSVDIDSACGQKADIMSHTRRPYRKVSARSFSVLEYADSMTITGRDVSDDASELIGKEGHRLVHYKRPDGSHYPFEECPLTRLREIGETLRPRVDRISEAALLAQLLEQPRGGPAAERLDEDRQRRDA